MLAKALGYLWVVMGALFLLKPALLKNFIQKKMIKKFKKLAVALSIFLGVLLIKVGWGHPGILPKIIIALGIWAVIKGIMLVKSKVSEKIIEWAAKQPLHFFRIGACIHIAIGIALIFMSK